MPGQKYTFGIVKAAQARGDFQVLADRNRRALRVHLGADVAGGLGKLQQAIERRYRRVPRERVPEGSPDGSASREQGSAVVSSGTDMQESWRFVRDLFSTGGCASTPLRFRAGSAPVEGPA